MSSLEIGEIGTLKSIAATCRAVMVHQEMDVLRADGDEMRGEAATRVEVVDAHEVKGAAFWRRHDVIVDENDRDSGVAEDSDDLLVDARCVTHKRDRLEDDACDVLLRKTFGERLGLLRAHVGAL